MEQVDRKGNIHQWILLLTAVYILEGNICGGIFLVFTGKICGWILLVVAGSRCGWIFLVFTGSRCGWILLVVAGLIPSLSATGLRLTEIAVVAFVYQMRIQIEGHIQVKSCFQDIRNRKHYRITKNILDCEITLSRQAAIRRKKENRRRNEEKENMVPNENKSPQANIMVKKACALLNSGGGVLKMVISDYEEIDDFWHQLDKTWQPFEQKLTNLVKPLTYNDVFDLRVIKPKEIHLFINAPQHLCTIHSNLYFAGDAGTYEASFEQAVNMLQNLGKKFSNYVDVPLKDLPNLPKEFTYKEKLDYHETRQTQFKYFTQDDPILGSRCQQDAVQKHISAFGNTIGGEILLGVTNHREVLGVDMKKNSQNKIEEQVNSMIKNMKFPVTPRRSVHWDIEFIPVSGDTTTTQERAVVAIKVAGMKNLGGVFMKRPESYELLDHDTIQVIEFGQWKRRMLSGAKLETDTKGPTCSPILKQSNGSETLKAMVQPSTASVDAAKY